MRFKFLLVAFISASLWSFLCSAQKEFGFKMPENRKKVSFSFDLQNNLVIVPVTINHFFTLNFILDTGVETAILTERVFSDLLGIAYVREILISGPGIVDSVEAMVATEVTFELPEGVIGENMNMIVLKEDYLKLSENIGKDVHGIIGYDIFQRFIVDVNYRQEVVILTLPSERRKYRHYTSVPIKIEKSKPFIRCNAKNDNSEVAINMLVDTGASHSALIDFNVIEGIDPPDTCIQTNLGRGIGGEIPGTLGRLQKFSIQHHEFEDVLVSAPMKGAYNKLIKRGSREGTIGGQLLKRFRVVFDYSNERIFLKKSSFYKKPFEYDMSGLSLNATGKKLDSIIVERVYEGRPAANAGLKKGDIILSINGHSPDNHSLSFFFALLRSRDGRKIKVRFLRDGTRHKTIFRLERSI